MNTIIDVVYITSEFNSSKSPSLKNWGTNLMEDIMFPSCNLIIHVFLFLCILPEMVTCLRGHTGLVKGLTWDPVGKYIASQADDHSLKVWRTVDWQMEANITKPFSEVLHRGQLWLVMLWKKHSWHFYCI